MECLLRQSEQLRESKHEIALLHEKVQQLQDDLAELAESK